MAAGLYAPATEPLADPSTPALDLEDRSDPEPLHRRLRPGGVRGKTGHDIRRVRSVHSGSQRGTDRRYDDNWRIETICDGPPATCQHGRRRRR
jgi:hypothetical protein